MPQLTNTKELFFKRFPDEESCRKWLVQTRWKGKPTCPYCECPKIYRYKDGIKFKCSDCESQFRVTTGAVYENSKIPLRKWLFVMHCISTESKSVTSIKVAAELKITQKSAWKMLHKIRKYLAKKKHSTLLDGIIEVDETYVPVEGKKPGFKYKRGRGSQRQQAVFGMLSRLGKIRLFLVKRTNRRTLERLILKNVKKGATIMSDEWKAYNRLHEDYEHFSVEHGAKQYAIPGGIHVNTIEGAWGHFKNIIRGTHHHVSRQHLDKYCAEFEFKYNHRDLTIHSRFQHLLEQMENDTVARRAA